MSGQSYHYIGDAQGDTRPGGGVQIVGAEFHGRVRTRLYACGECGAVVSEGRGQQVHDFWHVDMANLFGAAGVARWVR